MTTCSIDNCVGKVVSYGLCDKHRKRRDANGDPRKVLRGVALSKHYFWRQVKKYGTDGCWIWLGSVDLHGYGRFGYKYRRIAAHRFAWILSGNKLEKGMVLDHLCRNPSCVNPFHLEQITQKENCLRGTRYHPELVEVGDYNWGINRRESAQSRINHLNKESQTNI